MSEPLPVVFTKNFEENLRFIPQRDQNRILYDINHMNRQDILRQGYYKSELNFLRKLRNGDYRVILTYCADCYPKFRYIIKCEICDRKNLERIVVFFIYHRKKLYQRQKIDISKIRF